MNHSKYTIAEDKPDFKRCLYNLLNPIKGFFRSVSYRLIALVVLMSIFGMAQAAPTTYYSRATGNWTTNTTWSLTIGGAAVGTGVYPVAGDIVTIASGHTVTVNAASACATITVTGTLITSSITSYTLTVSGNVSGAGIISGYTNGGTKKILTIALGGDWSFSGTLTNRVSATINGTIDQAWNYAATLYSLTVNKTSGTLSFAFTPTFSKTLTLTKGDINYSGGAQNILGQSNTGATYPGNLILSGTGTKTFNTATTKVTGSLILSGTASATLAVNTAISGDLNIGTGTTLNLSTFTANRATSGGTLTVAGTMNLAGNTGGQGTSNFPTNYTTMTMTGGTVNYSMNGAQTVFPVSGGYNNLTLSGTGTNVKTTTGVSVSGLLSIEGTATVSAAISWSGTAYGLQYKTTDTRTVGSEWITPFTGTAGVTIANTAGSVSLNSAKVLNTGVPLNIASAATLTPGANLITLGGDFIKAGTLTSGSGGITVNGTTTAQTINGFTTTGPVILSGSVTQTIGTITSPSSVTISGSGNQTIAAFTTTGTGSVTLSGTGTQTIAGFSAGAVSMTKTGGTATLTGNASGTSLTINGPGGTLNLGSGLTHTFTGDVTLTAGTLDGGLTNTINANSSTTTAWSGDGTKFTPGTSKVVFGGTNQTLGALNPSFYDLTFSGANSTKSVTNKLTILNTVSIGTVSSNTTVVLLPNLTTSEAKLLQYGTSAQAGGTYGGSGSTAVSPFKNATYFGSTTSGLLHTSTDKRLVITSTLLTLTAGSPQTITISALNSDNSAYTGYAGSHNLTFTGANSAPLGNSPTINSTALGNAISLTFNSSGIATATMVLYNEENAIISATDQTINSSGSDRLFVDVSAGSNTNLSFTTQPGGGLAGATWATQPIVAWKDSYGNAVTNSAKNIALTPSSGGVLSGTTTVAVNTSNGMAAFTDLSINNGGSYTLTAAATSVTNGTSSSFNISNPVPTLSAISPTATASGESDFTLTVSGTNFNTQSVVKIGGASRATTYINGNTLTATILAADIASGGTPAITVFNPTPGGGTSSGQTLTVRQILINATFLHPSCYADGSITLNPSGGQAPYTYDWFDLTGTINPQNRTGLQAGSYSVTVTDADGVSASGNWTLTAASGCAGIKVCKSETASILSVPPDPANTSYSWTLPAGATVNGSSTNANISVNWSGVAIGPYTISVSGKNDCGESISKSQITVYVEETPTALATADLACTGGNLYLHAFGGTSYSWTGPNSFTSQDANPVLLNIGSSQQGTYTVTATNGAGCSATSSVTVTVNTPPSIALNGSITSSTTNNSTGAIPLTVTGGTTFIYQWSAGDPTFSSTDKDLTLISSDSYTITASNETGCSTTKTYIVSNSDGPTATANPTNVTCYGSNNGSISLSNPAGGNSPYTYSWSGPNSYTSTTQSPGSLAPGTYSVVITDKNNFEGVASATITEPSAIQADGIITNINCFGASTGSVVQTVSGGVSTYTYAWTGPNSFTATTKDITNRPAGTYQVVITDHAGLGNCTLTKSYTITQPSAAISATPTITNVSCNGGNNGQVVLAVSGGTAPYTYDWRNSGNTQVATTKDISGRVAGTYSVTITDSKSCSLTLSVGNGNAVVITQPTSIDLSVFTQTNVSCNGGSNGAIDLTVGGGTSPYTYVWSNGPTTQDLSGLFAGTYTVNVTDAKGCTATTTFTITEPAVLSGSITGQVNVLCNGGSTGTATAAGAGGTIGSGYSYSWNTSPVQTNATATGLAAGVYTVTITDHNLCTVVTNAVITESQVLSVSGLVTNVLCNGASTGAIDITAAGGATPYKSYNWNSGASTSEDRTALIAGTYQVTVTDNNNCTVSASYVVTQSPAISLTGTIKNVNCKGGSDGSVGLAVSGGVSPYTFAWTGTGGFTATTHDINNIPAGTYNVTVTDANLCTAALSSQVVGEPAASLSVVATPVGTTCNGGNDGSISVVASGGTGPYTYAWSTGATGTSVSNLAAGTYSLVVTDAKGCTASPSTESVTIAEPANKMQLYAIPKNSSSCSAATGSIDLTVVNGTAPYAYAWTNTGQTVQDPTGLAANTYKATVTDNIGCSATLDVTVGTATALSASVTTYPKTCLGTDGSAYAVVAGGVEPYTYLWSNGATTQNITSLNSGDFTVTVTDANGCSVTSAKATVGSSSCAAPVVVNDNFQTNYNSMLTGNVGSNDTDPDAAAYPGSTMEFFNMSQPSAAQGTLAWGTNADGSFTFTPAKGYVGTFSLKYKVFDASGLSADGTFTITVGPKAFDDPIGTSLNTTVLGDVKTNDFYEQGSSFTKQSDPSKGVVTFNPDGTYTYTPNTGATGDDSFTYSVCLPAPNGSVCSSGAVLISIDGSADLGITNVANTGTPNVGGNVTFTLTATDNGPNMALGATVTDKLPVGYTYVSDNGLGTYNPITGKWTIGTIANGGSASLNIVAKVNPTVQLSGEYMNTATVTGTNRDPVLANNSASSTTVPVPQTDISIVNTSDNPAQIVGQNEVFTLTVTNNGPSDATGVNVSDALPAGFIFMTNSTPSNGTFNSSTGAWTIGNLAYLETATMTITAKVNSAGSYSNIATVSSTTNDPALANNSSTVVAVPGASADLKVVSTVNKPSAYIGSYVEFTITATNNPGLSAATGVIVNDLLPAGYTYVSDDATGAYNPLTGDWTIGNLASGGSKVLKVIAKVNSSGSVVNPATIGTFDMPDPDHTNNTTSSSITVIPVADLSVTNSVNVDIPVYGSNVVFTVTVTNNGPSTSAGVVVNDLLPSGYTFVSDDGSGSYINGTGAWSVGSLANGASKTLNITAKVKSTGDYITTAVASATTADLTTENNTANKTTNPIPVAVTNLTVSDGILVGNFDKNTYSYTDNVPYSVSSMTVTPTFEENNPTITVCVSQSVSSCSSPSAVISGSPSQPLNLQVGDNWITTVVTAADHSVKTYKIKVTRADLPTPDVQATNIDLSLLTPTSMSIDWTNGNGAKRLVFIREATSPITLPANNTTYTASTIMGNAGSQVGSSGTYCVYNGAGNSVDITGLTAKTNYVVEVFEYNGESGYTKVNTTTAIDNPMNGSTPYKLTLNSPADFAAGNRVSYVVTRQFADGTPVSVSATDQSVYLYASGTTGSFYDAASGGNLIQRVVIPAGATSANFWFTATKPGGYNVTASDKFPADGNTGLIDATDPINVTTTPTQYLVTSSSYTANGSTQVTITAQLADQFGNPIALKDQVVTWSSTNLGVFGSPTSTTNASGIATVTYTVSPTVGTQHTVTATTGFVTGTSSKITVVEDPPLVQANNISFTNTKGTQTDISWINGNGTQRVVFMKQASSGTTVPVNNTDYSANPNFGDGTQIPTGWYCVYNGTGSSVTVTGLAPLLDYQVQVFDYKGTGGFEQYDPSTAVKNPQNFTTTSNDATLINLVPSVGSLSPDFASGTTSYTESVASSVTQIAVTPTATASNSTITVEGVPVISGQQSLFKTLVTGVNTITTVVTAQDGTTKTYTITIVKAAGTAPDVQAHDISFPSVGSTTMTVNWANGNGTSRAVFIKQASTGVALPIDNTTYTANAAYGSGTQIGSTGWYCIYNGSGNGPVSLSGLSASTDYTIEAFEYNGSADAPKFNTSTATLNPNTQKTTILINEWIGFLDQDWFKEVNWNLHIVPTINDNVNIRNIGSYVDGIKVDRYPQIFDLKVSGVYVPRTATCKDITIATLASVTVMPTGKFDVSGNIMNNHTADSLGLVVKSSVVGTGSMIVKGTITGPGTVERFTVDERWYLVSSPTIQLVKDFLKFNLEIPYWQDIDGDPSTLTDQYALAPYITEDNKWDVYFRDSNMGLPITNHFYGKKFEAATAYKAMTSHKPYVSLSDPITSTLTFKGSINVGEQAVKVRYKGNNSWNCVGNPFTSAICLNPAAGAANGCDNFLDRNIDALNSKGVDKNYAAIYFWDPTVSTVSYDIVNRSDLGTKYAQVGQGFFVKGVINDKDINFTPTMQVHLNVLPLKTGAVEAPQILLNATFGADKYATKIRFIEGTTDGLDVGYDAGLFRAATGFALYTRLVEDNGVDFQLQCLPTNQYKDLVIPVGVDSKSAGEVVFSAVGTNLESGCKMILEDRLTNTFTDLSTNTYKAAVVANTATAERFFLHTSDIVSAIGDQSIASGKLRAYAVRNVEVRIIGEVSDKAVATMYNALGQVIFTKILTGGNLNIIGLPNLNSGVYPLMINDKGTTQTIKVMVRR